jgi:hypothetical protein
MWILLFLGLYDHDHLGSIKGVDKVKVNKKNSLPKIKFENETIFDMDTRK